MSKSGNVSHWIDLIKEGDSVAAHQIWHHYFDRLVRSVRKNLRGQNRGVSDEEDIVVSVFESFYRAAENGRFPDLSDRDDLWRLLLKMSARKIVDKRRHDRRQRRGEGGKVRSLDRDGREDEIIQVILAAGVVCARIKRLDYSRPPRDIRDGLDGIRNAYLRFGAFLGFAWWLLWIPLAVAIGFDAVVYPQALWISTSIGVVGLFLSTIVYVRFLRSENPSAERWRRTLAGESLRVAYLALNEVVDADIR
jgi:hypothetical protein